jgi:hypothetical protein
MRNAQVVLLCVCVLLAGCSLGGTSPSLQADNAPPGVSAETQELTNATELLVAHAETLSDSGFVVELGSDATVARNGETRRVTRQQVIRAESDVTEYNYTVRNPRSRFDAWGNETTQAVRAQANNRTRYQLGQAQSAVALSGTQFLAQYLTAGNWSVSDVRTEDGTQLVTLRSTTVPNASTAVPQGASDVRNYEAVVVVDTEGRIHSFEVTADYTIEGEDASFSRTLDLRSTSGVAVDRPDWVAEAVASSGS